MYEICGIIAEYNPLHAGHAYHIARAHEFGRYVVCVMSGSFTQRGEPAVYDKWARTHAALLAGADAVLELPTIYACAGAERFAFGAVRILSAFADALCFGSESGDIGALTRSAHFFAEESEEYRAALARELDRGVTFAAARSAASDGLAPALPNDVLACEYIKAIIRQKSPLEPIAVTRRGGGYLDTVSDPAYPSALSIRVALEHGAPIRSLVPGFAAECFSGCKPVFCEDMTPLLLLRLRTADPVLLRDIAEVGEGLESRMAQAAKTASSYSELLAGIKTKRYTAARVKRCLINALLGIDRELNFTVDAAPPAARVLGVRKESKELLSILAQRIEIITNAAGCTHPAVLTDALAADVRAVLDRSAAKRDFTEKLIIV